LNKPKSKNKAKKNKATLRKFLTLHHRMGIVSALFIILLSLTGLVLHHGSFLGLDNRFIQSSSLLNWYNIEVPGVTLSFSVENKRASLIEQAIYFNRERLPGSYNNLTGITASDFGFVIATSNSLLLLTEEGELIEELTSVNGVPAGITAIGAGVGGFINLNSAAGLVQANLESLQWEAIENADLVVNWSADSQVPVELNTVIQKHYAGSLLSTERLILDIHSGRIFGSVGALVVDIMAILFILMAMTGVWIWVKRRSEW
jgi:hypothetical protein